MSKISQYTRLCETIDIAQKYMNSLWNQMNLEERMIVLQQNTPIPIPIELEDSEEVTEVDVPALSKTMKLCG